MTFPSALLCGSFAFTETFFCSIGEGALLSFEAMPVKEAIEALYRPIESIVKTLAGPAAEEIGLTFRDSVQVWRLRRQVRLFERVKKLCDDAGIRPQAVKLSFLFDVVDNGSLEEDDTLQDMWASLLANAADPERESLASSAFPEVLRQISKAEAGFLYALDNSPYINPIAFGRPNYDSITEIQRDNLTRLGIIDGPHPTLRLTAFGRAFIQACQAPR
jgi:hypothetical protein